MNFFKNLLKNKNVPPDPCFNVFTIPPKNPLFKIYQKRPVPPPWILNYRKPMSLGLDLAVQEKDGLQGRTPIY